jgi:hypothetical protein
MLEMRADFIHFTTVSISIKQTFKDLISKKNSFAVTKIKISRY